MTCVIHFQGYSFWFRHLWIIALQTLYMRANWENFKKLRSTSSQQHFWMLQVKFLKIACMLYEDIDTASKRWIWMAAKWIYNVLKLKKLKERRSSQGDHLLNSPALAKWGNSTSHVTRYPAFSKHLCSPPHALEFSSMIVKWLSRFI